MSEEILQQIPVRLRWAGWESDTYTLRGKGWNVFINEQMSRFSYEKEIHIGVKDPENKLLIMGEFRISMEHLLSSRSDGFYRHLMGQGVEMKTYRVTDTVYNMTLPGNVWESLDQLEPSEGFASYSPVVRGLHEFKIFNSAPPIKEIFIPYSSVDQCLNQILHLQRPEQLEIKKGQKIMRPEFEARIYSIAA